MIETFFGLARLGYTDRRGMPLLLQLSMRAREFADVIVFRNAAVCTAGDLWNAGANSTPARLTGDVPAAVTHCPGAADIPPPVGGDRIQLCRIRSQMGRKSLVSSPAGSPKGAGVPHS